jgi:DNA-binding NarL/FixJ family response regulator
LYYGYFWIGAKSNSNFKELTSRELEIAQLVKEGKSNKEISKVLFITEGTVKNHISNILNKLDLDSRTKLANYMR